MSMLPRSHRSDTLNAQDWADQRSRIERIEDEISSVASLSGVTSWERDRLSEWKSARYKLTDKQLAILADIEKKVFGEENEDV